MLYFKILKQKNRQKNQPKINHCANGVQEIADHIHNDRSVIN